MLRKKILIGYGLGIALMAVVVVWAVITLVSLGKASEAILHENYKSILAAENMIDALERQDSASLLVLLNYADEGLQQFKENEVQFLLWFGRAKDNITIAGEAEIIERIKTGYAQYLVNFSRLRQLQPEVTASAGSFYPETLLPSFTQVRDTAIHLRELNQKTMFAASRRAQSVANTAIWSTVLIGLAAGGVGVGFSLLLSKRLVRPIQQMMQATEALAQGNYDVEVVGGGTASRAGEASAHPAV
jgi:NtrC-family two-component system sensor histidine kinase KinB